MLFRHVFLEKMGYFGAGAIISAYFLVSFSVLSSDGLWYQLLNLLGALGLGFDSRYHKAKPAVLINAIWSLIAAVSILKIIL